MSVSFHPLRVCAIESDTADSRTISLEVPHDLRPVFGFIQGQYLTLRATIDGNDVRRSYSICAGVDEAHLRVGVRRVEGGLFSNWLHSTVQVGDILQVMAPQGRFYVPLQPDAQRHYLAIAGGSGITPILSIMKTVLAREPHSRVSLLYANRTLQSAMFKEELEDLKNRYLTRLVLHYVFSGEDTEAAINMGLMNRDKVSQFLHSLIAPERISEAFICGPFQMNDEAQAALLAAGVAQERIHIERFGIARSAAGQVEAAVHQAQAGDAERAQITMVRDGLKREFSFHKEQPSILDAASAAGLEVPFSCTSGVCGTCRAKCMEGEVRMERNFALDADEVAAGFVLTCQSRPLTPQVVLSFDER